MRPWRIALPVVALISLAFSPVLAKDNPLVRLTFSSGWDALPALVAIERGFFAQEGLVVSGLAVPSSVAVINSLAAGTTDFAAVPQRVFLVMAASKVPVKVVAAGTSGTEMELVVDAKVKAASLADLKKKKIAVLTGSEAFPALIRLLNKAGLKPSDVKIVQLSGDDLTKAFEKKLADAVFETRHFTAVLVKNDQARKVLEANDVVKMIGLIDAMPLVARNSVIEKEPGNVQKVVTAWVKALKYIQQDPEDAARILRIYFHRQGVTISAELAQEWVKMAKYNMYAWSEAATADAEYNAWGLNAGGILKSAPKLKGYTDNRFAQTAMKAIGVQ